MCAAHSPCSRSRVRSPAERLVIVPACSRYAQAHEMTHVTSGWSVSVMHPRGVPGPARRTGGTHEVYLKELVSFVTDALVASRHEPGDHRPSLCDRAGCGGGRHLSALNGL